MKNNLGSVKRFGARYGRKLKIKFSKIEYEQRKLHKCPYCNAISVKRLAMGIWFCRKCESKFTGKAYTVSKKIVVKEVVEQEVKLEIPEEVSEEDFTDENEKIQKESQNIQDDQEAQPEVWSE